MADYLPVCRGTLDLSTGSPVCVSGSWVSVPLSDIQNAFDITLLDPVALMGAFASGFTIMTVPLLVIWGCKLFLISIKQK